MTPESGSIKQEDKISSMGTIAHKMHSKVAVITFKGVFRSAIKLTLEEKKYEKWSDLVNQTLETRKFFFEGILNNSLDQLKTIGLAEQEIVVLFDKLIKENKAYL